MEELQRKRSCKTWAFLICLMLSFFGRIKSLSVTVNDVECVYDYVLYEGDTVSGNFVFVDHDIFWGCDHPGIDFTSIWTPLMLKGTRVCYSRQKYLKARDTRHCHTNESTRRRVVFYTIGEYLLFALASTLQVVHIRRLFSKSVAYNRVSIP